MTINEKYQQARKTGSFLQNEKPNTSESVDSNAGTKTEPAPKATPHNKGMIWGLVTMALIFVVAAISCPKEAEHRVAVSPIVTDMVERRVCKLFDAPDVEKVRKDKEEYMILEMIVAKPVRRIMDNLTVSNHVVYSVGYITLRDSSVRISVGCFGHVFILGNLENLFINEWELIQSFFDFTDLFS